MTNNPYDIQCQRCHRYFPSQYYFSSPGLCSECFRALPPDEQSALQPSPPSVVYAGFWSRFVSLWVDTFVVIPIAALSWWASSASRGFAIALLLPTSLIVWAYEVYFHSRWGQTIGKMVTHIRVVSTDGEAITLRQATLRSSVDIVLGLTYVVVSAWAVLQIPASQYFAMDWQARQLRLAELSGQWQWLTWLQTAWFWSEVITMLFNRRRRAIHDYIAGTVVIRVRPAKAMESAAVA